jgi:hypothetical protein
MINYICGLLVQGSVVFHLIFCISVSNKMSSESSFHGKMPGAGGEILVLGLDSKCVRNTFPPLAHYYFVVCCLSQGKLILLYSYYLRFGNTLTVA